MIPERVTQRAIENRRAEGDHLISTYSPGSHGYPQVGWWADDRSHVVLVHRVIWESVYGPIPDELTIEHECKVKGCSRLSHLRLETRAHNAAIGTGPDRPRGTCKRNHDPKRYSRDKSGHLQCLDCKLERKRR